MKWCLHLLMCILTFYQRNDMGPWSLFSPWWELSKNALGDNFRYMIRSLWPLECHTAFCMYYLGVLCSRDDPPTCWGGPRGPLEGFQGFGPNSRPVAYNVVWHRLSLSQSLWGMSWLQIASTWRYGGMHAQGTSASPLDVCRSFVISTECNRLKDNSLQILVSELVRYVLIADHSNLKVWEGASPRYKCTTLRLVQNHCHQYRM